MKPIDPTPPPVIGVPPRVTRGPEVDAEQEFGAKVLPWIGALSVIGGLGYLVNYAIQKDLITPEAQMVGAAILSLIFAFIGIVVSRGEGQSKVFGNILVGLGSSGLYMTAAGGYAGWHLITGEAMIATFVGLAYVNLMYGYWRSLPPFVMMGILGGAIASGMLGHQGDHGLAAVVLALVGVPSYLALIKRSAPYWVGGVWLAGEISLITWAGHRGVPGAEYLVAAWTIAALAAHVGSMRRAAALDYDVTTPIIVTFVGVAHYWSIVDPSWSSALGLFALGGATIILSGLLDEKSRLTMLVAGSTVLGFASPTLAPKEWSMLLLALLGLGLTAAAVKTRREIALLGLLDIGVASLMYFGVVFGHENGRLPFDERFLIPIFGVVVIGVTSAVYRIVKTLPNPDDVDWMTRLGGGLVCWALVIRLVDLQVGHGIMRPEAMSISWALFAAATFLVGRLIHAKELRLFGLSLLMLTLGRVMLVELANLESVYKVMILIGVGILSLAISYLFYIRPNRGAHG